MKSQHLQEVAVEGAIIAVYLFCVFWRVRFFSYDPHIIKARTNAQSQHLTAATEVKVVATAVDPGLKCSIFSLCATQLVTCRSSKQKGSASRSRSRSKSRNRSRSRSRSRRSLYCFCLDFTLRYCPNHYPVHSNDVSHSVEVRTTKRSHYLAVLTEAEAGVGVEAAGWVLIEFALTLYRLVV